jgi:hypothetical protein
MAESKRTGSCLCGATGFDVAVADVHGAVCHCSLCRRWASGPFMGFAVPGEGVTLKGEDKIATYASSGYGERGFCTVCGSNLFWRMQDKMLYVLSLGALADSSDAKLDNEIFIDEKPAFYNLDGDRPRLTGAEFAAFMAGKKE